MRILRIGVLLLVLIGVAAHTWLDRVTTTAWDRTLWVGIYPLNADGSAVADQYIRGLRVEDFASIESFFAREAGRSGVPLAQPVHIELYPPSARLPPILAAGAGPIATAWWSLKLRWFALRATDVPGRAPSPIRVFVLYHDPGVSERVPHSLGLQKGLIGVVHAFADKAMNGSNGIVIAHETLHTLGATDKYDLATGAPRYPSGFADPDRTPLYPQDRAEIMAGQRALTATEHEMPDSLRDEVVGPRTAAEIGWPRR